MKIKAILALAAISLGSSAFAAEEAANMSPKDVCKKLVETAKTSVETKQQPNKNQLEQWVYHDKGQAMGKHAGKRKDGWQTMQSKFSEEIKDTSCGSETVAGGHAFVTAKSGDQERLIPFVMMQNTWKLDVAAYRMLYRMDKRAPASVSAKPDDSHWKADKSEK